MKNLPKYFKLGLVVLLILNINLAPFISQKANAATSDTTNFVIPQLSNAILPTSDDYTLSSDNYDSVPATQTISFTASQTGFALTGKTLADITGVSFRINYPDQTSSKLFVTEHEEDAVDEPITKLYTFIKTAQSVDLYYSDKKDFTVNKYPLATKSVTVQSASDAQKSAYEKEFMRRLDVAIITRDEWGAPVGEPTIFKTAKVNRIVVHHTAGSVNMGDPKITVKAIYDNHVSRADIGYDIGYNFLIDPYGNIYQGRSGPMRTVGAAAIPNTGSIGISMMGSFGSTLPTQAALSSLIRLTGELSQLYGIDLTLNQNFTTGFQSGLMGHRDVIVLSCPIANPNCTPDQQYYDHNRTACPGNSLEAFLGNLRTYANEIKTHDSAAKTAYNRMLNLISHNNLIINNGFVEIVLATQQINPVLDPRGKDTYTNGRFGINIKSEKGNLLLIEVDETQFQQFITEYLFMNPETAIQPNYKYEYTSINTNDTYRSSQWALDNTGQTFNVGSTPISGTNDADIDAPEAWALSEGTDNIIVAVIDTGVAYSNPDLVNNMWNGTNCKDQNNQTLGNCIHGYDYADDDKNPLPDPTEQDNYRNHGTHISGIIGAEKNNGIGVIGIAPKVKIMAIRSSFNSYTITNEVNFAKYNGAKIINASWAGVTGGTTCSEAYDALIYNAFSTFPGLVVVAAGNSSKNHNLSNYFNFPTDYGHSTSCWSGLPNMISVAATDVNDNLASFSDYGAAIDIAAPGVDIASTTDNTIYESYGYMSGTSMATPYVSGLAAYIWSVNNNLTTTQVKNIIINSGDTLAALNTKVTSGKRINAANAINQTLISLIATPTPTATPTPPPIYMGATKIWDYHFAPGPEQPLTGDFNGDGLDDVIAFTKDSAGVVTVALSNGSSFGATSIWKTWFSPSGEIPLIGDFNGDGKDDIATFTRGKSADVYVALSTGSSFGATQKWHDWFAAFSETPLVGDFNGDGKDDIITFTKGRAADVYVAVSNGSQFIGTSKKWHDWFSPFNEIPMIGDFNGDGRDDIATFTKGSSADVYIALSNGSNKFDGMSRKWHDFFSPFNETALVGDYNGDGRDDLATFSKGNTGGVWVVLSNGSSFGTGADVWHNSFGFNQDVVLSGKFNKDNKSDIIAFKKDGSADVWVSVSNGSRFVR
jgi:hypothetical protein